MQHYIRLTKSSLVDHGPLFCTMNTYLTTTAEPDMSTQDVDAEMIASNDAR